MFTKKLATDGASKPGMVPSGRAASAQVAARTAGSGSPSVVGAEVTITGNLECKGEVHVEGEVKGDIHAQSVVIDKQARITGALIAAEVVVGGHVQGSIRGNAVSFQSSSHVEGDVFHKSLAIEQGAFFEGKSRRSDDPMSVQLQRPGSDVPPPAT